MEALAPVDVRGRAALNVFLKLSRKLALNDRESSSLLGVSDRTFRRYRDERRPVKSRDTLERISHIANLWIALRSIFRTETDAQRWLTSSNSAFGDHTPLQRMLGGNVSDLLDVRYHIESALVA
jgi:uncharacterized protein (DUF2384 family)